MRGISLSHLGPLTLIATVMLGCESSTNAPDRPLPDVVYPSPDTHAPWNDMDLSRSDADAAWRDAGATPMDNGPSLEDADVAPPDVDVTVDAAVPQDTGVPFDATASCLADAPTACPDPAPHYTDLEPIFRQRCVICHSGLTADGPWPLNSYGHVADWQNEIRSELLACTMPPQDASVPITAEERARILEWLRCGLPE